MTAEKKEDKPVSYIVVAKCQTEGCKSEFEGPVPEKLAHVGDWTGIACSERGHGTLIVTEVKGKAGTDSSE